MAKRSSLAETPLGKAYLIAYNLFQLIGWSYLFYNFILEVRSPSQIDNRRLWSRVEKVLAIFQTMQIVEVLHCVVGLVPSNPLITLQQIAVKLAIVFGIVSPFAGPKNSYGVLLTIGCWSVAEITRYLYYALNILNVVPYLVTWCRYSFFLVLYPFGVLGELLLIYASLDEISRSSRFTWPLPNFLNVSFYPHYALVGFMLLYIPLFPPMYIHMLRQRRKIIGGVF